MIQTGSRSRRLLARPLAWIALLAILWAACAPLLMQMAPQRHAPLALSVDYCTEQGTATVQLPLLLADAGQADEQDGHGAHHDGLGHLEHCPFCRHAQGDLALLPVMPRVQPLPARAISYPPLYYVARASQHAWTGAQPRAPPAAA
ncbi:lipoprotein [Bordetella pertussis]|uniref:Lipoprotein n=16 Tax=Alcaligenaceae TaxID=506 RepID=Q7VUZ2_BORPE|nr:MULTISPECIES: DUF2946 domain-containing protein [Bordetella]ETH40121.1 PF11162 family protein [Bordetella pertussis H918]KCV34894.1 PF11162 family protein [Bordetella bronchiseptica 00-P-2730]KDD62577.1 PF11162 family protein [Bordetella bronchiseptica OSU553]AEE68127.1 putative lipoprotein [Bordetella pertussis CS]AIW91397.1 lipoprotein [Bordetella pertussis B1917]